MNDIEMTAAAARTEKAESAPFDREEWLRKKKEERENAFRLIEEVSREAAKDWETVRLCLELQGRFPHYSVGNIMLLAVQKPYATQLADYRTWKEAGAKIRWGEKGIILLEPGREYTREDGKRAVSFHTRRVFDVSQTTAEKTPGSVRHRDIKLLVNALTHSAPCEVRIDGTAPYPGEMTAFYDRERRRIWAAVRENREHLFREVARETARARMDADGYDGPCGAFTAMCVSYMLCMKYGLDMTSFRFDVLPQGFSSLDPRCIRTELDRMKRLAGRISGDMDRYLESRERAGDPER